MESYEMGKAHFDKLSSSAEGQKELKKFDEVIQFDLKDDESFYIKIVSGKVSVTKGKAPTDSPNMITLITDRATVRDIFYKGQLYPGLSDFMFSGKLWMQKSKSGTTIVVKDEKPITAWTSKLLRMHP